MAILSIIIPAYNEGKYIQQLLEKVLDVQLIGEVQKEVIVIDDCSTDHTAAEISSFQREHTSSSIIRIKHERNRGKGQSIHTGIHAASGDYLVIQDADLEYDPEDYNSLLKPIIDGKADVVYGSRFVGDKPHRVLFFWHYTGNRILTFLSNAFTNLNLTDMETCYKMFRMEIIKSLPLKEKRFGFEPEVTARISKIRNIRIYEVGISYFGRTYEEGKKISWKDGLKAIWCIFRYNLS